MRRVVWGVSVAMALAVVVIQVVGPFGDPREAEAIGSVDKPYVLSTPLFTPKDGSNSTLVFASMNDSSVVVNLRRYNAVGGLLSSTNVTLGAKSSIIAFAGANSGAQMHIEIWSPTPFFTMELTYTDPGSTTQKIPYGDMLKPFTGGMFMALDGTGIVCNTRTTGGTQCQGSKLGSKATKNISLAGLGGLPTSMYTSVVLLAQVENASKTSFLTFFPTGSSRPSTKHVYFTAGAGTRTSEEFTIKIPASSGLSIYNYNGTADLILRVVGYHI